MRRLKLILAIVALALVLVAVSSALPVQTTPQPARADAPSDKYDGDCTGHETAGRCADKCPADTSEGTYYLQGYDKDTGAAVCRLEYFHECPYAAAVSADDPLCDKLAAQQPVQQVDPASTEFEGK